MPAVSISSSTMMAWRRRRCRSGQALGLAVVADAPLLDDGQRRVESLGEVARLLGEASVGRDDGEVVQAPWRRCSAPGWSRAVSSSTGMLKKP